MNQAFTARPAPVDPQAFRPVADMLRCSAKLTGYTGPPVVSLLRGTMRNGLPMFQARVDGHKGWTWVTRVDLLCAFLTHRQAVKNWPAGDRRRRALRREWVAKATKPSQRTRELTARLISGGGGVEWRRPITKGDES